jgi:hypothetical protein
MKTRTLFTLAAMAALAAPAQARADLILLSPIPTDGTGGGLGNQLTVLTLLNPGNTTSSSGCVTPTSFVCASYPNANVQQGQSQVQLLSQPALSGLNGSNLRVVLNLAEPSTTNNATLNAATLTLYSGTSAVFSGSLAAPVNLNNPGAGIGNYGFIFGLDPVQAAQFNAAMLANPNNLSIGFGAAFTNVQGGPETFSIARATDVQVIPEPATVGLMATGLLALGGFAARRRKGAAQA